METNNQNNPVLNQEPMMQYHTGEPQALPMMGFWESVRTCFRKYFDFKGRARRSEYWWYCLFSVVACLIWALFGTLLLALPIGMAVQHVSGNETAGLTTMIIILCIPLLFLVLPSISVQVRRLHDTGRSGWWQQPYRSLYLVRMPSTLISWRNSLARLSYLQLLEWPMWS